MRSARLGLAAGFVLVLVTAAVAMDDTAAPQTPSWVTPLPVAKISVKSGKPAKLELRFKVADGYHINSNQPGSELLIPTKLQLNPPTDIGVGSIAYPPGHDLTLAVAPDQPLNVYTGEFTVTAKVSAARTASPGKYKVHGQLKYQACNDRSCFPPKLAPVEFEVEVLKRTSASGTASNPAQSPHAHQ
ncbi:MAG: protein-disulfide reductase DsbD domain-containing protein [Terriglobales bacterium]